MEENPSLNNNNFQNFNNQINNNISNDMNTHQKNTNSGNMYSYRDDSINEPPKESNAIRRSLGPGFNPPPYTEDLSRKINKRHSQPKRRENIDHSSEMRIPPPNNNDIGIINVVNPPIYEEDNRPKPLYRRRNNENNTNYLITYIIIAVFHVILITLIGLFYEFDITIRDNMKFNHIYIFFKDIHAFIFIGFGMLYTALRDHQWSSMFLVLILGVIAIEFSFFYYYLWANTFSDQNWSKINIDFQCLSSIEYNAASAIIALGALLGKLSLIQYFVVVVFETFFANLNYFLCHDVIKVIDNGGSLCIHTFGAVFGLAVSAIIFCNEEEFMRINNNPHITSNYLSNMFAFIGSIFLWLFFPSFNVANIQMKEFSSIYTDTGLGYITENMRYRGIINTYLSMMGSVLSAFIVSPLFYKGKMKIEHILHASYVGGIIIGGCCTICSSAWAAVVIGIVGSTVTIIFLWKIKKLLHSVKFEDTIGVLAIFAIPGFLGGIVTAIFAGNFDNNNAWNDGSLNAIFGRSNNKTGIYAGLQIAGIFISLGIAAFSGLITGLLARVMVCTKNRYYFVDSEYFVEEIGVVFPEYIYGDEKENNLNSSGNKLNLDGREVNINNNPNLQNNNKNNIDNNNVSEEENSSNNNLK